MFSDTNPPVLLSRKVQVCSAGVKMAPERLKEGSFGCACSLCSRGVISNKAEVMLFESSWKLLIAYEGFL